MAKRRDAVTAKNKPAGATCRGEAETGAKRGHGAVLMSGTIAVAVLLLAGLLGSEWSSRTQRQPDGRPWRQPDGRATARYAAGRCGIAVVNANEFSGSDFQELFNERAPVLVRGLSAAQAAHEQWNRSPFAAAFGALDGAKTVPLYTAQFGTPTRHRNRHVVSLESYLQDLDNPNITTSLLLDRTDKELGKRVITLHGTPEALANMTKGEKALPIVSLGASGAGLALHQHAQTWLSLLRGRKVWFLMAPNALQGHKAYKALSLRPPSEWPDDVLPSLLGDGGGVHVCEQLPGDILYVPTLWYHATQNDGEVLGAGMQQTEMYPPTTGGAEGALKRHPESASVKFQLASILIEDMVSGKNPYDAKAAAAALAQISSAIKLEPLEFSRRCQAAKSRVMVAQLGGADGAKTIHLLLNEWGKIDKLATDLASRGVLSQQHLAAVLVQLVSDAALLPDGVREKVVGELQRKAKEAHSATFEGFLKRM